MRTSQQLSQQVLPKTHPAKLGRPLRTQRASIDYENMLKVPPMSRLSQVAESSAVAQSQEYFQPKLGLYMVQNPSLQQSNGGPPARHNSTKNSNLST